MKKILFGLLLLLFSITGKTQDTIFMKSGTKIPAEILEVGDIEIKYKRIMPPNVNGVYTVFKYEVESLHYKSGRISDFTSLGINEIPFKEIKSKGPDISGQFIKFGIGISENYFSRTGNDNLETFWRFRNGDGNYTVGGNPQYLSINLSMLMPLGGNRRNWLAAGLQLINTPEDAILASVNNGANEIKLKTFYYNIQLIYGRSINYKKNLIFILEPSLDIGMMSGNITVDNDNHKLSALIGMGSHFAVGIDWNISKRFTANFRVGQKFLKIDESHASTTSSSGYATFYADPRINNDLLFVSWAGQYASVGLSFNLYTRMPK
jgi:hypothetical protein